MAFYTFLPHRGLMTVKGIDRFNFLQGLISNDMRKVEAGEVVWAALLSPQGKFLHDFFIFSMKDVIYLDCEYDRRDDLLALLLRYKLRAKVTLDTKCILETGVAWGNSVDVALRLPRITNAPSAIQGGFIYRDPRLPAAGLRWALPKDTAKKTLGESGLIASEPQIFDLHRFSLGLPDGSRDMEIEKALLLENGFEELHGIDFQKGCYMGQELTARTHYRALIKKRLMPVTIDGPAPLPGTPLKADGIDAGEMKSSQNGHGLALVRLAVWRKAIDGVLDAGGTKIKPFIPEWMNLPNDNKNDAAQT